LFFYALITRIFHWIAPLILKYRLLKNKEDTHRYREKLGFYHHALKRPDTFLVRIHGASVGETLSSLPIIEKLLSTHSDIIIMVTSNTLTSASLMKNMLPSRCFHLYAPLDTPQAVDSFYKTYKPDIELILDSEIWPNGLMYAHKKNIPVFGVNTRLSDKSMKSWAKNPLFLKKILSAYTHFFVQNETIASFIAHYFNGNITMCDNLKWATTPTIFSDNDVSILQEQCKNRFIMCLLSTHEAEEKNITDCLMKQGFFKDKNNLLIIVPRHPHRKNIILNGLKSIYPKNIECRSDTLIIDTNIQIYLADTLGEIMLWSSLADLIFMGNSLSLKGGGHNPIEPASLGKPLCVGNKIQNFTEIYDIFKYHDACVFADNYMDLAAKMMVLKNNSELCHRLAINSYKICETYRTQSLMFLDIIHQKIIEMKNHAKS
jgi:3-deoxy-D-manno-octulosonic-acid transferase